MNPTTRLSRRSTAGLVIIAVTMFVAIAVAVANRPSPHCCGRAELADPSDPRLSLTVDAERKHRAAQITSTFENSTLELQYDYVENIGDGRGITAGRAASPQPPATSSSSFGATSRPSPTTSSRVTSRLWRLSMARTR
jgi:hypothetical protein